MTKTRLKPLATGWSLETLTLEVGLTHIGNGILMSEVNNPAMQAFLLYVDSLCIKYAPSFKPSYYTVSYYTISTNIIFYVNSLP